MNTIIFTKPALVPFISPASVSVLAISAKCAVVAALGLGALYAFKQAYQQICYYNKANPVVQCPQTLPEWKARCQSQQRWFLLKSVAWGTLGVAAIITAVAAAVLLPTS